MLFEYYRNLFLQSNESVYWGGETTTRYWNDDTLYLYFVIISLVILFAYYIQKKQLSILQHNSRGKKEIKTITNLLKIIFLFLLIFLGFRHRSVGMDTISYSIGIENDISLKNLFSQSTAEPLYLIFQYFIHIVFDNGTIGIFIYSYITIYFIYSGLKKYELNISLFISILVYICLYYFPSFNLLRISLAASIVLSFFNVLLEGYYKKFALLIIITSLIHFSTIVVFIPFGLFIIYRKHRKIAILSSLLLLIIIILASISLSDYLYLINRYSHYMDDNVSSGRIGVMLFVDYLPCIIISYFIIKGHKRNVWADVTICFTISALIIRLLAYYISIAGRLHTHFMSLTMIIIPYWILYFYKTNKQKYYLMQAICIIWCFLRLHLYFSQYLSIDGIMPYHFIAL